MTGAQRTFQDADVEDLELEKVRIGVGITWHYNSGLKKDIPPIRHTRKLVLATPAPMLKGIGSVAQGVSSRIVGVACVAHPYFEVIDSIWTAATGCKHS